MKCKIGDSKVWFSIKELPENECQHVTVNFEIDCSCAHLRSEDDVQGKRSPQRVIRF